jgi:hypothetical protein
MSLKEQQKQEIINEMNLILNQISKLDKELEQKFETYFELKTKLKELNGNKN